MEKIGIIDVGGGMRDIYGAGVFDYLMDNNIDIKYCIGISAGSANVASYISRQKGKNKRYFLEYAFRKEYISFNNLQTKGSYIDLDYVFKTLSNEDGEDPWDYDTAMKNDANMIVIASNAKTAEPEYFYKKDFKKNDYGMFAASCCIPVVCKEYEFNGKKYFDGSITDPIPVKKALEDGCTKVFVILTRPIDYRKTDGKKKILFGNLKKTYPKFAKKLSNRCELYNSTLEGLLSKEVKEGKVIFIAPKDDYNMKTLEKNKSKLKKMYKQGYEDGKIIKEYIEKNMPIETFEYEPKGVCSRKIILKMKNNIIKETRFIGGCDGNTKGICALIKGMTAEEVIKRLEGIDCNQRGTSCPDQLAKALKKYLER